MCIYKSVLLRFLKNIKTYRFFYLIFNLKQINSNGSHQKLLSLKINALFEDHKKAIETYMKQKLPVLPL